MLQIGSPLNSAPGCGPHFPPSSWFWWGMLAVDGAVGHLSGITLDHRKLPYPHCVTLMSGAAHIQWLVNEKLTPDSPGTTPKGTPILELPREQLYWHLRAAVTKSHRLSALEQQIHCHPVLEARSLKSRCQRAVLPLRAIEEDVFSPSPSSWQSPDLWQYGSSLFIRVPLTLH